MPAGDSSRRVPGLGRVVMVVPTYNEALNLEPLLGRLRRRAARGRRARRRRRLAGRHRRPRRRDRRRGPARHRAAPPAKEGLGAAYLAGFEVALDRGYDVIGEMDADGSHQPEQLQSLLDALRDADLVIGSRWVPGGSIVNWPRQPRAALARRQLLHPPPARHLRARRHGRLPPVPPYDAGADRARRGRSPPATSSRPTSPSGRCRAGLRVVRGADRVRRAGARRVQDEPPGGHRVAEADHPVGSGRASPTAAVRCGGRAGGPADRTAEQPPTAGR